MSDRIEARYECAVIAIGLCQASVCTSLDREATAAWLNGQHPTGIASAWKPSADNWFSGGQPNPCPCDRHSATHQHMLFNC